MQNTAKASDSSGDSKITLSTSAISPESLWKELSELKDEQLLKCGNDLDEAAEGETLIAKAPEAAQKFFTLSKIYLHKAKELTVEMQDIIKEFEFLNNGEIPSGEKISEFFENELHERFHVVGEYTEKGKVFAELGWIACHDVLGRRCINDFEIRKNWQIVKNVPQISVNDELSKIFGGAFISVV